MVLGHITWQIPIQKSKTFSYISGIGEYEFLIDNNGDAEANYTVISLRKDSSHSNDTSSHRYMQNVGHFTARNDDELPVNIAYCLNYICNSVSYIFFI